MDSFSYLHKYTLLAAKWGAFAPPLPPLNPPLVQGEVKCNMVHKILNEQNFKHHIHMHFTVHCSYV